MNTRSEVSILRLYMLRAMYAFMAIGLAIYKLPAIFNPPANLSTMGSVVLSVLAGLALLAGVGIHRPLKMLPLLFFVLINNLVGIVLVPLVMPWSYVFNHYLKAPGDPWRK